jgi:hypothetical protein
MAQEQPIIDVPRIKQAIACIELKARVCLLLSAFEEVSFTSKDVGCVGLSLLEVSRMLEEAVEV